MMEGFVMFEVARHMVVIGILTYLFLVVVCCLLDGQLI